LSQEPSTNGKAILPAASPEEAAAIVGALERFLAETAPAPAQTVAAVDPWRRAALLEGIRHQIAPHAPEPWING
jgi:hypothetical protein